MIEVIIDCDPGIDDALALIFALKSEDFRIRAITTVGGNVPVDRGTENMLKLLELTGRVDIPVAEGSNPPMLSRYERRIFVHGEDGLGNYPLPTPKIKPSPMRAKDTLKSQIEAAEGELNIITLGPLTNLASIISDEPKILHKIKSVTVMGGAISCPGNVTSVAEFNIYMDPVAARKVFNSGLPITLVPLDVTMKALLLEKHIHEIEKAESPITDFISKVSMYYLGIHRRFFGIDGCPMHDPLATAYVNHPEIMRAEPLWVDVETKGELTLGETVADLRSGRVKPPPNMNVCLEVDTERFLEIFIRNVTRK